MENEFENLTVPLFHRSFKQRVSECWHVFLKGEEELRKLIDENAESDDIMAHLEGILAIAFTEVYAEVGFNGEKYDLILNLEGNWARLFELTYFKNQAPKEVFEHWNILVGRQSRNEQSGEFGLRIAGNNVSTTDFEVWLEWEDGNAKVSVYCEKLLPLLKERAGEAYWITYIMLDYAVGELAEMKYISDLEILCEPLGGNAFSLGDLLSYFQEKLSLSKEELFDEERYCQLYSAYQMQPQEEADDGLRRDVFAGSSCVVPLLNDFWNAESRMMDDFHKDGIVAGYFCYPLYGFEGDDRGAKILDFRDEMVERIENLAGPEAFLFIGGASGIYYGYIDFIAWDLEAVLDAAQMIFEKSGIDWVMYHGFRQDIDGVTIFAKEEK